MQLLNLLKFQGLNINTANIYKWKVNKRCLAIAHKPVRIIFTSKTSLMYYKMRSFKLKIYIFFIFIVTRKDIEHRAWGIRPGAWGTGHRAWGTGMGHGAHCLGEMIKTGFGKLSHLKYGLIHKSRQV